MDVPGAARLRSQKFGELLRNPIYMGVLDAPDYGIHSQRGDFTPLIDEKVFYRVQAVLQGRAPSSLSIFEVDQTFPPWGLGSSAR